MPVTLWDVHSLHSLPCVQVFSLVLSRSPGVVGEVIEGELRTADSICIGMLNILLVRRCTLAFPTDHLLRTLPAQPTRLRANEIISGGLALNCGLDGCPPGRQQLGSIPTGTLGHSLELLCSVVMCRTACSALDWYLQTCNYAAFSALFC